MAQQTKVILIDDVDGGSADETVEFGIDGKTYAIDLSDANAEKLRGALEPYVSVARRVTTSGTSRRRSRSTSSSSSSSSNATAIRAWAKANGIEVNARGRIPKEVTEKYLAAGN